MPYRLSPRASRRCSCRSKILDFRFRFYGSCSLRNDVSGAKRCRVFILISHNSGASVVAALGTVSRRATGRAPRTALLPAASLLSSSSASPAGAAFSARLRQRYRDRQTAMSEHHDAYSLSLRTADLASPKVHHSNFGPCSRAAGGVRSGDAGGTAPSRRRTAAVF